MSVFECKRDRKTDLERERKVKKTRAVRKPSKNSSKALLFKKKRETFVSSKSGMGGSES